MRVLEGQLTTTSRRFAIVAARFNDRVVDRLVDGALDCLTRHGVDRDTIRLVRVPGAWEIPPALEEVAARGDVDALIALGVVIKGETPHFDYVCSAATSGIAGVQQRHRIPVGFGLLTCGTSDQAVERAGGKAGNKGWEAAIAALEMADLFGRIRGEAGGGAA